jgi:uncharacterized coiled-coil protein SlyX
MLFNGLQKIQELEDKLREKEREIDKLGVYIKQYQAHIQSMKARLDIMMRYTWRVKPFVNPHDMTSRRQDPVHDHYLLIVKFALTNIMEFWMPLINSTI